MTDAFIRNMLLNVLQNDDSGVGTGASEEEIQNLPRSENEDPEMECAVCMSSVDVGVETVNLRCGHSFHQNCIARWLRRSSTCPNCRTRVGDSLTTHPLRGASLRPSSTYNITYVVNDVNIRTTWNSNDTIVDVMDFVSRLHGVDKVFEIRSEHLSFKNTESYSVLRKSLVRCGLENDTTFRVVNHPNIMVIDLV